MSLRLAVAGCGGRMGRAILEAAALAEGVSVAAAFDVGADVPAALATSDVLIDFTRPEGTMAHLAACRASGTKLVIGTTGFEPAQLAAIAEAAKEIAIVLAPNMSVGVNVALKLVELAAKSLPDYDVEVFEIHHRLKVDAPSGTALKLAEAAAKARGALLETGAAPARNGTRGERRAGAIGFSSARGGDIVGDHTVYFAGPGERIEITHRSSSRANYAQGAIRAALFLAGKPPGLHDMQDVLGLR